MPGRAGRQVAGTTGRRWLAQPCKAAAKAGGIAANNRRMMRILLRNPLGNVRRHSAGAAQPPYLRVEREASEGGHAVRITVRDYGAGVGEYVLPHLAEALYRPDSARGRTAGGVGLGLYLCKLVGQAHGGSLTLRNAQPGWRLP